MKEKQYSHDTDKLHHYAKQISLSYTALNEDNERGRRNKQFVYGDQWGYGKRREREENLKLTYQFNFLKPIIRSITGQQAYTPPALEVRAMNEHVKQEEVTLVDEILRYISYASKLDYIQRVCFKNQVTFGRGAMYAYLKYEDEMSFDQVVRFGAVEDVSRFYYDATARDQAKQTGDFQGIITPYSPEEYKNEFGHEPPSRYLSAMGFSGITSCAQKIIPVAHHFVKEYYTDTIVRLSNGEIMTLKEHEEIMGNLEDEYAKRLKLYPDALIPEEVPVILDQRKAKRYKIKHLILDGERILDETEWPSKLFPGCNVPGDSEVIDGVERYFSFIDDVKDAQKMYNYGVSEVATSIAMSRREQFWATQKQIEGYEDVYRNTTQIQGACLYNPDERTGGGPPVPNTAPAFNRSLLEANTLVKDDLNAIMGRYEEGRGEQSNAITGVAIANRQIAENKSLEVYYSNLNDGLQMIAQIAVSLIPSVYDGQRTVMAMDKRNKARPVDINKIKDGNGSWEYENEIKKHKYDVAIIPGPSYAMQKEATFEQLMKLSQASTTPAFNIFGDKMAQQINATESNEIADRIAATISPSLIAAGQGKEPPPPPPPSTAQKLEGLAMFSEVKRAEADMKESHSKALQSEIDLLKARQELEASKAESQAKIVTAVSNVAKAAAEVGPVVASQEINSMQEVLNSLQETNKLIKLLVLNSKIN